ncbi:MAG: ATP-binding cassette domain-containing protein [Bacteroidaceae bacterium]|nr:ATP-binding cassette domain-containing protein [Bacteroidaceae bacterium]
MNSESVIKIENGVACAPENRLSNPVCVDIKRGWQVAVVGNNGSGKSLLVNTLLRQYPLMDNKFVEYGCGITGSDIRYITFRDSYGTADPAYFYQQRWNSTEMDDSPVVSQLFPRIADAEWKETLFKLFDLGFIWEKQLVTLSSGEMRKYQLAKALAGKPRLTIIDSPFIGLDPQTRSMLCNLLENLVSRWGIQIILVVSREKDIPEFITHVIPVHNLTCYPIIPKEEYRSNPEEKVLTEDLKQLLLSQPSAGTTSNEIVKCNGITLQYGNRKIFNQLEWTIMKGERWALLGENGAGKSALLSMVYADNPQSYACNISLFGNRRGTGESIWEIKKHIGYVSPEMHRSYARHYPVIDIVASGLHDTIGLYKKIHDEERDRCMVWLKIFGLYELRDRDFFNLSSGEQRMVLLARAFVKNPALIILDEPLHGLDDSNRSLVMDIIRTYCSNREKTMIIVTHYPEELPEIIDKELRLVRHS